MSDNYSSALAVKWREVYAYWMYLGIPEFVISRGATFISGKEPVSWQDLTLIS